MKIYTIRDVARLAGVSVTTVSRVLNHRPDVSPTTRERVEQVMAECHFVGNASARSLKQADVELIVMILRGRDNTFLHSLAEAILRHAAATSAMIQTVYIDEQDDEFDTALRLSHEKRVTGFIFLGTRIDERARVLAHVDVPMITVTASAEGTCLQRAASVTVDDRRMGHAAVQALLDRGHKKVAVFGGSREGTDPIALRYQGAMDAFIQAGVPFDPEHFREVRFSAADGYEAAQALFAACPDTTAVFCVSDLVAAGVLRALCDLGLRVPEDVSVIGFDGMELGKYLTPRLSTVAQPLEALAQQTVAELTHLLSGGEPRHITIPSTVEIRESVR